MVQGDWRRNSQGKIEPRLMVKEVPGGVGIQELWNDPVPDIHGSSACHQDSVVWQQNKLGLLVEGWSMAILSFVKKSQVRNFRWSRRFCASLVVLMFCREG